METQGTKKLEATIKKKGDPPLKYRRITGEFPPVFKFESAGQTFAGKLIKIETITIKKGFFSRKKKATYIIMEETSSKKQWVIWATVVLKFLLIKSAEKPAIGDDLLITYGGLIREKGRSRHEFEIRVAVFSKT